MNWIGHGPIFFVPLLLLLFLGPLLPSSGLGMLHFSSNPLEQKSPSNVESSSDGGSISSKSILIHCRFLLARMPAQRCGWKFGDIIPSTVISAPRRLALFFFHCSRYFNPTGCPLSRMNRLTKSSILVEPSSIFDASRRYIVYPLAVAQRKPISLSRFSLNESWIIKWASNIFGSTMLLGSVGR
jgi:hypothetical protein